MKYSAFPNCRLLLLAFPEASRVNTRHSELEDFKATNLVHIC